MCAVACPPQATSALLLLIPAARPERRPQEALESFLTRIWSNLYVKKLSERLVAMSQPQAYGVTRLGFSLKSMT